jgi:hypothetical protein
MNSDALPPSITETNHGNPIDLPGTQPASATDMQGDASTGPTPEDIERLTAMHTEAAKLNRLAIRTGFQQAIQDAMLAKDEKTRRSVGALCAAFHQWAEGESLLGLN